MQFLTYMNLFLMIFGAVGSHFRWLSPIFGFTLFSLGVGISAFLFFPAVFRFFRWGLKDARKLTLFLGILSLAGIGYTGKFVIEHPLNDVSTDAKQPPKFQFTSYRFKVSEIFTERNPDYIFDKSFSLASATDLPIVYPKLRPLLVNDRPDIVYAKIESNLKELPNDWKMVLAKGNGELAFELEQESEIFRFVDDIIIEVRPHAEGVGSEIHFRSKSRYGKSDLGANYRRIQMLQARLAGISPPLEAAQATPQQAQPAQPPAQQQK